MYYQEACNHLGEIKIFPLDLVLTCMMSSFIKALDKGFKNELENVY